MDKKIETILFAAGEPIKTAKLASILKCSPASVTKGLEELKNRLSKTSGLALLKKEDAVQLVASRDYSALLKKLFEKERREELGRAALEVLAIVAYEGPIKRAEIEEIRGVNSAVTIRGLTLRGLIEKEDRDYALSFAALRRFGLDSTEELPRWREIKEEINNVRHALNRPHP